MSAKLLLSATLLLAAACAAPRSPYRETYVEPDRRAPRAVAPRPDHPGYGAAVAKQPLPWSAESMARDFVTLTFHTEQGGAMRRLLKHEGQIRVAIASPELASYRPFLEEFIGFMREHAPEVPLSVSDGRSGEITVVTTPRANIETAASNVLCFVAPGTGDADALFRAFERGERRWSELDRLEAATVVIPAHAAPAEIRSCLIEEVTQALGPVNDVWEFGDSIFNDDQAHIWPTAFDLAILRILYSPRLRAGMTRGEAREAALAAARDLGLTGRADRGFRLPRGGYGERLQAAHDRKRSPEARAMAAREALALARKRKRASMAHLELQARVALALAEGGEDGFNALRNAESFGEDRLSPDDPRLALARLLFGIALLDAGAPEAAATRFRAAAAVFASLRSDAMLAHALRWLSVAERRAGRGAEARRDAAEALAWARYVWGIDSRAASRWKEELGAPRPG